MAPRAYWKGYLKLSLVSCPISLFPATSEREKISFHQINKDTGHRIKYRKVGHGGFDLFALELMQFGHCIRKNYFDPAALLHLDFCPPE